MSKPPQFAYFRPKSENQQNPPPKKCHKFHSNFSSLWFAQSGLESMKYSTRCKHANYYTINAVFKVL